MNGVRAVNRTALVLVIIGALNWLLVGLFQYDAVAALSGGVNTMAARAIYIIVGIAGLYSIALLFDRETVR